MTPDDQLGALLERFLHQISHPRGRALAFLARSSVTVDQAILLDRALAGGSTATALAAKMGLSLPSVSQMVERLVRMQLLERAEDAEDRRRKTLTPTAKARRFLRGLQAARAGELATGAAQLSRTTQRELAAVLRRALHELDHAAAPKEQAT